MGGRGRGGGRVDGVAWSVEQSEQPLRKKMVSSDALSKTPVCTWRSGELPMHPCHS
jgi:hypothetical protein